MIPNEVLNACRTVQKKSSDPDTLQAHATLLSIHDGAANDVQVLQDLTESFMRIEEYKEQLKEITADLKDRIKGERDLVKSLRRREIASGQISLPLDIPVETDAHGRQTTTIKIPAGSGEILRKAANRLKGAIEESLARTDE